MSKHPSPSDQRSNVKNPNNPAYQADVANRQSLGHPGVPVASPPPAVTPTPAPTPKPKP